jgi:hypothetical protein
MVQTSAFMHLRRALAFPFYLMALLLSYLSEAVESLAAMIAGEQ